MGERSSASDDPAEWDIWIDTGGTFTDCIARRAGETLVQNWRRAKVLSTSAQRGVVAERISPTRFRIVQNWGACDDFVAGFQFGRVGSTDRTVVVRRFDAGDGIIDLVEAPTSDFVADTAFEVRSAEPAAILAARLVTQTPAGVPLPPIRMRLATTRGTNALLERRGAPTALFITAGFGDLLLIGDQHRPDLFALNIVKPAPLHEAVVEVRERLSADGSVLNPLELDHVAAQATRLVRGGITSAAIALLHSYINSSHERQVAACLRAAGFTHVAMSSDLAPLIRILPRAQTAVVEAYLDPVIENYLRDVQSHLRSGGEKSSLHVMTSAGGLVRADSFRACESLLSGPAGGVAGAAAAGRRSGFNRVIGFDMGGTSTDVARFDGDFEYCFEHTVADVGVMSPALSIETVAAGGGSICDFINGMLTVGPHSAGANPGPACYGASGPDGPLTLTDVNLLLGRLVPEQFEIPIDPIPAELAASRIVQRIQQLRTQESIASESVLEGFLDVANERMAAAIERISVRQGVDPRDYALVAFGGAGGQHACAVAERLGISVVIMPADASLLSALGLGQSVIERFSQRQVLTPLRELGNQLAGMFQQAEQHAVDDVMAEGINRGDVAIRRRIANLRLQGQDSTLAIDVPSLNSAGGMTLTNELQRQFGERYRAMYGHDVAPELVGEIEVESIRVVASTTENAATTVMVDESPRFDATPGQRVRARFDGKWIEILMYERGRLSAGATIVGPALVLERQSTCVIEVGWIARMDHAGALVARHDREQHASERPRQKSDLIELELFSNRLSAIADEMGQLLQRVALSTNVKERLDFSCAILNAEGELIVNAPHIPVHLGALGVCVRAVRDSLPMEDGDVVITNHPAFGGSHLPDVTVITPVVVDGLLIAYTANRAHHAEIGGTRPGSMPPAATTLAEEGVVIPPMHLIRKGQARFEAIEQLLQDSPFPSRSIRDNLADIRAAVAANQRGVASLHALAKEVGIDAFQTRMNAITDRADRLVHDALLKLGSEIDPDKDFVRFEAIEMLDDGSPIQVKVAVHRDQPIVARIDFTGTASTHPGNLNATPAIVRSAVMYVLRLLMGRHAAHGPAAQWPLNEGILRSVNINIPPGMLNPVFTDNPQTCPAVVGGNTETSQRVVDALLKAFNIAACSQGTMNNVLFGNERFGYYETVCGGGGAAHGCAGADAVHTHMTNTRITDPEIIEHRYPVRVDRFAIRRGSGGAGLWRGGDGAEREFTFLEPMALSVLSQHRVESPFGINGGGSGKPGKQRLIRAGGSEVQLRPIDQCDVQPGDRLVLETPGGGGCGM